ncbi:MAG: hypothetical protein R3Y19_05220 [Rikenellaceae bacterium]
MRKQPCPQCHIPSMYIKNSHDQRRLVYVNELGEVFPRNAEESLDGYDTQTVYCLGCSWSGSPKRLARR